MKLQIKLRKILFQKNNNKKKPSASDPIIIDRKNLPKLEKKKQGETRSANCRGTNLKLYHHRLEKYLKIKEEKARRNQIGRLEGNQSQIPSSSPKKIPQNWRRKGEEKPIGKS